MPLEGVSLGYGGTIEISEDSGSTWTKLAGIQDHDIPFGEAEEVDVTHMESPNRTREFIAGLKTQSDITFPMLYVGGSTSDVLLRRLHSDGDTVQIRFGDVGSTENRITFTGYVKNYTISKPVSGARMADVVLKVNAEVVA